MPPSIFGHGAYGDSSGAIACNYFAGTYRDTSIQMDGVKFVFNSGNIDFTNNSNDSLLIKLNSFFITGKLINSLGKFL